MKKRVSTSEIERAKSSTRKLYLLSTLCVVILFVVIGTLCILNVDSMTHDDDLEKKGFSIEKNTKVAISLDENDENIKELFDIVRMSNNSCEDLYLEKNSLKVTDLSDRCKFVLASNSYKNNALKGSDGKVTIDEEYVRRSYEKLFGIGSYVRSDTIPYQNMTLLFKDHYYYIDKAVNEKEKSLIANEVIVKAIREGDSLYITSSILYYEKSLNLLCRDSKCKYVLENVEKSKNYNEDYLNLYIIHNQERLNQYTYHFEADDGGFYHYVGYQKTNQ